MLADANYLSLAPDAPIRFAVCAMTVKNCKFKPELY